MSEPLNDEAEVLDGLPVLGDDDPVDVGAPGTASGAVAVGSSSPTHTAAAAVGGFVAGAAVVGLVHRRHAKRRALSARRGRRASRAGRGALTQIVASRSLLVDVHLLGSSGAHR